MRPLTQKPHIFPWDQFSWVNHKKREGSTWRISQASQSEQPGFCLKPSCQDGEGLTSRMTKEREHGGHHHHHHHCILLLLLAGAGVPAAAWLPGKSKSSFLPPHKRMGEIKPKWGIQSRCTIWEVGFSFHISFNILVKGIPKELGVFLWYRLIPWGSWSCKPKAEESLFGATKYLMISWLEFLVKGLEVSVEEGLLSFHFCIQ